MMLGADGFQDVRSIGDVIVRNAKAFESKTALISATGHQTSFRDLARRVQSLLGGLQSLGLKEGSRVAILSRNRPEFFEAVCVSAGGMVAVPLNWRLNEEDLAYILRDCQPEVLLVDRDFMGMEAAFRAALASSVHLVSFDGGYDGWLNYEELHKLAAPASLDRAADPDLTACIVYTSGTTGRPKGAELTHRGLLLNCRAAVGQVLKFTPNDVSLAPMPFFHVGGLWYHMFPSFAAGCTTVILPSFDAAAVLESIDRDRITNVHLVPTMLHALLEASSFASTNVASLRLIFYAASSIPPSLLGRAMKALPSVGFVQGYGSTEAGMVSCLTEADHRRALMSEGKHLLLSCGRALDGVRVHLMHVADGMGEIGVQSDMMMKRYWRNPEASQNVVRDGVLLTGDLGYEDTDGYLYLQDRRSDMIVTGGENVYPREVEEALIKDERLAEVAVFDLPDDKWVQRVVAAVVPKQGVTLDAASVMISARQRLAGFKCPKEVFIVESLPHNPAGKVLRKELRRIFGSSAGT